MPGALKAHEFGDVFEILAKYVLLAFGDDRHVAHAERQQPLAAARIVQNVDRFKFDPLARKKLFRPETGTSARLSEKYEFFGNASHDFLSSESRD
jgi:hypothetical protein